MEGTIRAGTVMMQAGTLIPESVGAEVEPFWHSWGMIKNSQGDALDRDIRRVGWNFFFLAAKIQAMVWGHWGERNIRRAVKRVLRKAGWSNFNCLQITELTARRFWGLSYVHISAHSRHIQKSLFLQSLVERSRAEADTVGEVPARSSAHNGRS